MRIYDENVTILWYFCHHISLIVLVRFALCKSIYKRVYWHVIHISKYNFISNNLYRYIDRFGTDKNHHRWFRNRDLIFIFLCLIWTINFNITLKRDLLYSNMAYRQGHYMLHFRIMTFSHLHILKTTRGHDVKFLFPFLIYSTRMTFVLFLFYDQIFFE